MHWSLCQFRYNLINPSGTLFVDLNVISERDKKSKQYKVQMSRNVRKRMRPAKIQMLSLNFITLTCLYNLTHLNPTFIY